MVSITKNKSVDLKSIIKAIGKHFPHSLDELRSKNRNKDLVFARQVAMYLMKRCTNKSLREIGAYLGGRNHATVKHALSKIETQVKKNLKLQNKIHAIEKELMR